MQQRTQCFFYNWCCANRLSINISKTNLILFSNIFSSHVFPDIILNNVKVDFASSVRFLGVQIDEKLKFKDHINSISSKGAKSTGVLYKLRQYLPLRTLISVYRSLVESHLNYCNLIFGNAYETHIHALETAQKKCIRIIAKQQLQAHTNPFFSEMQLLKIKDIYKWNLGIYRFKHRNDFETNNGTHNTRSRQNYYRPIFQRLTLTQNQSIFFTKLLLIGIRYLKTSKIRPQLHYSNGNINNFCFQNTSGQIDNKQFFFFHAIKYH